MAADVHAANKRFVRFTHDQGTSYGLLEHDTIWQLRGGLLDSPELTGRAFALREVRLLVPCEPTKVLAVGLNYASHRQHVERTEGVFVTVAGRPVSPTRPVVFAKFPTSLIPHDAEIVFPNDATNVHFEGELVLVIGKPAKNVAVADAKQYVFGATIGNDLVDREWLLDDLQWFRAKGADGFGPLGPVIVAGLDYGTLTLETRVNGKLLQSANTSELVFSPDEILSFCSRYVTLLPGDVIFTGTPGVTQKIDKGDTVEVAIEHLGVLRNRVAL